MYITPDRIAALAPHVDPALAVSLSSELNIALPMFGAAGAFSRAHFMAEACHETQGFTHFTENLNYSHADRIAAVWPRLASRAAELVGRPDKLAEAAYGGRMGNGPEGHGDGWRYRGRGFFHLTGRENYGAAGVALKADLLGQPDLVAQPRYAVQTALWFWQARDCVQAATRDDVEEVVRRINGSGMQGFAERKALTEVAKRIFV